MKIVKNLANGPVKRRSTMYLAALMAVMLLAAVGCGKSNHILYVGIMNQNMEDDPIHVEVKVDERVIFDKKVPFDDGHHIETISTRLSNGIHVITVRSKASEATGRFEFRTESTNWVLVTYWHYDDKGHNAPIPGRFIIENSGGPFVID